MSLDEVAKLKARLSSLLEKAEAEQPKLHWIRSDEHTDEAYTSKGVYEHYHDDRSGGPPMIGHHIRFHAHGEPVGKWPKGHVYSGQKAHVYSGRDGYSAALNVAEQHFKDTHKDGHFALKAHEAKAAKRAFPLSEADEDTAYRLKGIAHFHGAHPDMVRSEVARAVKAHPDLDKSLDEGIYDAEDELQKTKHEDLYTEDMAPHHGKKVFVYYNLHHKVWSVRHEGKVIAHTKQLHLKDAKFKVSEAGRQRVLSEKRKNVHAGVVGTITEPRKMPDHKTRVSYNPYNAGHFYDADHKDKPAIHDAAHVHMEVNEGTDPNGHQVRFPRVHALRNTAAKLRKAKIDALAKAEERKWPTEAAPKLEFSTTPPPTPGQGPHSLSRAQTKHGEYRISHTMGIKPAGREGDHHYESDPGGENHSVHYEPNPKLGPGGEYSHTWSHYLGDFPSKEAAFQHAHGDHVARHYGLSPDDVAAANKAWPEHGLSRFTGVHPEMVRSEMERARSSFKKVSSWRDRLHKMAIKDIKPGKRVHSKEEEYLDDRPPKIYDYSHVLSPKHRKAGYSVELTHYDGGDGSFNVHVRHRGKAVGHIEGEPYERDPKTLWVNNAQIEPKHRGKGLGTAGYEALYGHAKNVLGFKHAAGGLHSSMASKVHQRLAEKHGLKYRPQANPLGALDHRLAPRTTGEYDQQLGPYSYALKSER